ncbi:DUF6968 family protein [Methylobacterium cerastii]|uniref:DUF6968 family protein n=1 Tax=Methylobacterium cerastii TaxID=932741 RepID=UPI003571539C
MLIATRLITLIQNSDKIQVEVRLFAPTKEEADWICRYEIDWPSARRSSFAAGLDSMQAIYLAQQKIGIDIYMSNHHAKGSIYWQKPNSGYGFPVPKNGRVFLVGEDKLFDG